MPVPECVSKGRQTLQVGMKTVLQWIDVKSKHEEYVLLKIPVGATQPSIGTVNAEKAGLFTGTLFCTPRPRVHRCASAGHPGS